MEGEFISTALNRTLTEFCPWLLCCEFGTSQPERPYGIEPEVIGKVLLQIRCLKEGWYLNSHPRDHSLETDFKKEH